MYPVDNGCLTGLHTDDILCGQYLEGKPKTAWVSLSESMLRDQSLFDSAARLQDDVVTVSNPEGNFWSFFQGSKQIELHWSAEP